MKSRDSLGRGSACQLGKEASVNEEFSKLGKLERRRNKKNDSSVLESTIK